MKYLTLFSSLLAVAAAVPLAEVAEVQSIQDVQGVQVVQDAQVGQEGQAKDPSDTGAQGVKILKKFAQEPAKAGLTRVTKKIGTWTLTSAKMVSTFKMVADSPCGVGGCYVTAMEATIRYPDGKEANVDTQAWLHHIAMFGSGTGGGSIWACGNERPTLRLNAQDKYGIDWPLTYMMMVDLMTEVTTPKTLTLEVTYEIAPKLASGYKAATMYWLSLGPDRAAKDGKYSFDTQALRVTSGKLLYSIGHMHDGGTDMQLFVESSMVGRSGKMVCKSVMHYGEPAAAGAKGMEGMDMDEKKTAGASGHAAGGHGHSRRDGHGGHGDPSDHIQAPGACTDFGTVSAGQYIRATAQYDATIHKLMVHNGQREKLMGNMRVYVGPS
ncbi:hypothetical protein E2P81_ATG11437 [Venturia nashicola]|uniref:Uncharacterized protein n=1 Tax=Venturia nashicola TaxID=86259 RepID=A0A4Z1P391_9PEZI|nr:hypothetical protein E6O75_ATG11129 [Venturia nashicola]TLD35318.1 hypothetical protein E2P81_ATG11437 [Venturia nashicola]